MFEKVLPFVSATVAVALASERWHRDGSRALRKQVFCREQGVFAHDDRDEHDQAALTLVALSTMLGMHDRVVGTVRIFTTDDRVWYGGRLAVLPEYRRFSRIGERLTIAAVSTAKAHGAQRFLAAVQQPNVGFFERQHFRALSPMTLHGLPHVLMEAALERFSSATALLPAHAVTSAA